MSATSPMMPAYMPMTAPAMRAFFAQRTPTVWIVHRAWITDSRAVMIARLQGVYGAVPMPHVCPVAV